MQFFSVPPSSILVCSPLLFLSQLALLSFCLSSCRSPVLCLLQLLPLFLPSVSHPSDPTVTGTPASSYQKEQALLGPSPLCFFTVVPSLPLPWPLWPRCIISAVCMTAQILYPVFPQRHPQLCCYSCISIEPIKANLFALISIYFSLVDIRFPFLLLQHDFLFVFLMVCPSFLFLY